MKIYFSNSVCFALLNMLYSFNAEHVDSVSDSVSTIPARDAIWTENNLTMLEYMAVCFQRTNCLSVQFSENRTCLGLRGKFVKNTTVHDGSHTEYTYVTDKDAKEAPFTSPITPAPRQAKGKTTDKQPVFASRKPSARRQAKNGSSCGPAPSSPNAEFKPGPYGGFAEYTCKSGFVSCSGGKLPCLATGKWDISKFRCIKNEWNGPFGNSRRKFDEDIPCGPLKKVSVHIVGLFTGGRMRFALMRKSDVLFYMDYKPFGVTFCTKLKGKWKTIRSDKWRIDTNILFRLNIVLFHGEYALFLNDYLQTKIPEQEKGGTPLSVRIEYGVRLNSVIVELQPNMLSSNSCCGFSSFFFN